jgi:hypothetical protein
MAVTVNVYAGVIQAALYGAVQKTNTIDLATRSPFFVTLRSVGVETFNANENTSSFSNFFNTQAGFGTYLRAPYTGVYATAGNNELATGNGYTKGGKPLTNARLSYSSGVLTLKSDDVRWTATGSGISAKSALLCYEFPVSRFYSNDPYTASCALAMIDFDGTQSAPAGTSFTLQWPAAGILKWQLA